MTYCLHTIEMIRDNSSKSIQKHVKTVAAAEFVESPHSSDRSSDGSNILFSTKPKPKAISTTAATTTTDTTANDENKIDGITFYYRQHEIRNRIRDFLKKHIDIDTVCELPKKDEQLLREWAYNQRKKAKDPDNSNNDQQQQQPNLITSRTSDISLKSTKTGIKSIRIRKIKRKDAIKHISGYMYGPFTKQPTPDRFTIDGNKFNIPQSMIDRAKRYQKKQKIQENVLRRVRLSHMGFEQPPQKDESSDDESIQNVKKLALIRTPYFIIPTIKISQVRKKDRFRNKYLKNKARLKRINMFLNEKSYRHRTKPSEFSVFENASKPKTSLMAKFMQLINMRRRESKAKEKIDPIKPEKAKYLKLIRDKYSEYIIEYDARDKVIIFVYSTLYLII